MPNSSYSKTYSNSYALLIGIDKYADPALSDLYEAEQDARSLANVLSENPYSFEVTLLTGSGATKRAIEEALFKLRNTEPDDRIIVYFAGHGYIQADRFGAEKGFIACYDTDPERDHTALELDKVTEFRLHAEAKHIAFILDSCFSGQSLGLTRSGVADTNYEKLLIRRSYQVLSSGAGDQPVADHKSMTHFLVKELNSWKDRTDEILTLNMLGLHLQNEMLRDRGKQQIPQFGHLPASQGGDLILNFDRQQEQSFHRWNLAQWESILKDVFPVSIPKTCVWEELHEIIAVLSKIGTHYHICHLFFPSGGGLDLTGAKESYEEACIELESDGAAQVIKPKRLIFHSFKNHIEWAYFRLESGGLEPSRLFVEPEEQDSGRVLHTSSIWEELKEFRITKTEELVELMPLQYVERDVWIKGYIGHDEYGDEIPLPDEARVIARYFEGDFVIFAKRSPYNLMSEPDAYSAPHTRMSDTDFRDFIELKIEALRYVNWERY